MFCICPILPNNQPVYYFVLLLIVAAPYTSPASYGEGQYWLMFQPSILLSLSFHELKTTYERTGRDGCPTVPLWLNFRGHMAPHGAT